MLIYVRASVRPVQVCLEQSIFIFLGQRAIRAIKALKSESYSRSLKYCVLFIKQALHNSCELLRIKDSE